MSRRKPYFGPGPEKPNFVSFLGEINCIYEVVEEGQVFEKYSKIGWRNFLLTDGSKETGTGEDSADN